MTEDHTPPIVRVAKLFAGRGDLPTRITAPMRRMAPEQWSLRMAELLPVLLAAGIHERDLADDDVLCRWASLVHVVAVLSGTTNDKVHSSQRQAGRVLFEVRYSEARLSKLLSAKGGGLRDQVPRLARFLRAKSAMPLDLRPIAALVLHEGRDQGAAESARLDIARSYYAAADRAAREEAE